MTKSTALSSTLDSTARPWRVAFFLVGLFGAVACLITWLLWTPATGSLVMRSAWIVFALTCIGGSLAVLSKRSSLWVVLRFIALVLASLELWVVFVSAFTGRHAPGLPPVTYFVPAVFAAAFLLLPRMSGMVAAILFATMITVTQLVAMQLRGAFESLEVQNAALFLLASLVTIALLSAYARVQEAFTQAKRLAATDPLTGLANRRLVDDMVFDTAPRGVILLDLDHFKRINDEHGHAVGDEVLRETARRLTSATRSDDRVCRWGGEEFLVLLADADASRTAHIAERLRQAIAGSPFPRELAVTVSVGVAVRTGQESLEAALGRADKALYAAKAAGRNLVHRDF